VLVYLGAVAALVHEPPRTGALHDAGHGIARRVRTMFATARAEAAASVTVRVILTIAVAFGFALSAVELLWQHARATLISGESLAAQGGALVANLTVGALAAAEGTATAWAMAGALLALTGSWCQRRSGARCSGHRPRTVRAAGPPSGHGGTGGALGVG
jgi:hypothetical protein